MLSSTDSRKRDALARYLTAVVVLYSISTGLLTGLSDVRDAQNWLPTTLFLGGGHEQLAHASSGARVGVDDLRDRLQAKGLNGCPRDCAADLVSLRSTR